MTGGSGEPDLRQASGVIDETGHDEQIYGELENRDKYQNMRIHFIFLKLALRLKEMLMVAVETSSFGLDSLDDCFGRRSAGGCLRTRHALKDVRPKISREEVNEYDGERKQQ